LSVNRQRLLLSVLHSYRLVLESFRSLVEKVVHISVPPGRLRNFYTNVPGSAMIGSRTDRPNSRPINE
jgi:hypothetical protein